MKKDNYLKSTNEKSLLTDLKLLMAKLLKFQETTLSKVVAPAPVEDKVQKVEVTNQPKIELKETKVDFPPVQKVEITNHVVKDIQKVEVTNQQSIFKIADLPVGVKDVPGKANPDNYIVVRITDGKSFVRPTDKVSAGGGGGVAGTIGNNVYTSQVTISGATVLGSGRIMNGIIIQALSTNAASIYVGAAGVTTSTGFELQAGQATSLAINDLSKVYVTGTQGDKACYITTN